MARKRYRADMPRGWKSPYWSEMNARDIRDNIPLIKRMVRRDTSAYAAIRPTLVSGTPRPKYWNARLRQLRAQHGVGKRWT